MRRAILAAASVLAGLVLSGCDEHFFVEMQPKEEGLERTLVAYSVEFRPPSERPYQIKSLDESRLKKIREHYREEGEADPDGRRTFKTLVKDLHVNLNGGTAQFMRLESNLGVVSFYSESFEKENELAANLEKRLNSANQLADMLREWFEMELANEPRGQVLLDWIDKDFRTDIKNLAVYSITHSNDTGPNPLEENIIRVVSFLARHGYLAKEDVPRLARAVLNLESAEGDQSFFDWLQRFVARKMGVADKDSVPESLAFLGSREKLIASMQSKLSKTKTYQAQHPKDSKNTSNTLTPDNPSLGNQMFIALVASLFPIDFELIPSMEANWRVSLKTPVQPFRTNGSWMADEKAVNWSFLTQEKPKKKEIFLIYAAWSEPSERQTARFGKVLLDGQRLAGYALWYQALHENERAEWTAFVDTIKPGDDVAKELESFRFKGEKALDEKEVKPALSNAARDIFREALAPEAPTQQEKP